MNEIWRTTITPTIQAAAYSTGDVIGGKLTFANAVHAQRNFGIIDSIIITDKTTQTATFHLTLFNADPTGTTFTENTALTLADADLSKITGVFLIDSLKAYADNQVFYEVAMQAPIQSAAGGTVYGVVTLASGTPTYVSTSDLTVTLAAHL